jgi:hypothetical protein
MKTLATHPELVRAWLLAQAGMPLPSQEAAQAPQQAPSLPPPPYRH